MQKRLGGLLVVMVCAAMPVGSVLAAATLITDARELDVYAEATEGFGSNIVADTDAPAFGAPYSMIMDTGLLLSPASGAAEAQATASQISSFNASPFSMITASGTAHAFGTVDSFSIDSLADVDATSDFVIQFSIASPQQWSMTASILDDGASRTAYVRLREVGAVDFIFNLQTNTGSDSAAGTLPAGVYEIMARAFAAGFASSTGSGFFNRDAEFSFEFTVIPEPASGLILLCCGGLALRRARR